MEKINISDVAKNQLNELVLILFEKEYFGFVEDAESYVNNTYQFIYTIPSQRHKTTFNSKHGTYYCYYKHNRKTTWYITFDKEDDCYLIKYITNNHSTDYPKIIAGTK